jgi:hypothetical protein
VELFNNDQLKQRAQMKPVFFKSIERLAGKAFSLLFLFGLLLAPLEVKATDAIYISPSSVTSPPNVDATAFLNTGRTNGITPGGWVIANALPFKTAHTLYYTNTGTMFSSVGWEFDYGPTSNGGRGWSSTFLNDNNAVVAAVDSPVAVIFVGELESFTLVSATNIINKGTLQAGAAGEIQLIGNSVLLSRSLLDITPIVGAGSINGQTNFIPDTAIYDQFWLQGTNILTVFGSPWNGATVAPFTFTGVGEPCGVKNAVIQIGPFTPLLADSYTTNLNPFALTLTNFDGSTTNINVFSNLIVQAVFVNLTDPNITAINHFSPSLSLTNPFQTVAVQFAMTDTNVITQAIETNTLYLVDDLASSTNVALLTNTVINISGAFANGCNDPTFRPSSVVLSRSDPGDFAAGAPGFGTPSGTFFFEPFTTTVFLPFEISEMFSNAVATGRCETYSALVDNLASEPPPTGIGSSITNAPGRIHIYAHDLDLTRTRMRAEAQVVIMATNLLGSTGARIDCENLSYNLGSTNGFLNITNLALSSVYRLHGTVTEWSGLWTNHVEQVFSNYMQVVTTTATNSVLSPYTNVTEVDEAITVVDAGGLLSTVLVNVQDFVLHSTNMVVSDFVNVQNTLLFDGQSLTMQGGLNLVGPLLSWTHATAPTLRFFTNNGTINIPDDAHFGDDGPTNYAAFVNHGEIFSGSQKINSDYLEMSLVGMGVSNETFASDFIATCKTGVVANASILSEASIQFFASALQFKQATLFAFDVLNFTVSGNLSDGGFGAGNSFTCENGFNLFIKPVTGDLLGTTVTDVALSDDQVNHVWAGVDRGATAAGYSNNVVIRKLVLDQDSTLPLDEPLFHFSGATAGNGLYVSNLDLSTLIDIPNQITVDPNLTIYFVSATLNPSVNITPFPTAEQYLTNLFGGRLVWVSAGISGLVQENLSGVYNQSTGKFQLNMLSVPAGQTNIVEASTNLVNWVPIYTNVGSAAFTDSAANSYPRRFYRTKTLP